MKRLYNKYDRKILKEQLQNEAIERITLSYYKYHQIKNTTFFRDYLYLNYENLNIYGRVYVANEGINAQISVPKQNWDAYLQAMNDILFFDNLRQNIAIDDDGKSFFKLKVKTRAKIVADGLDDKSFDVTDSGIHLDAKSFNEIADKDNTTIIDMRNHYESEIGHFKNAITPDVDTFRESLPIIVDDLKAKKDENIVMYCTGGIRCEKASAWMKHNGFKNVFQLDGGIIEYSRQIKAQNLESKFVGKNFVFDERLGERISDEIISKCHQCGELCDNHTNCINEACHLLFIQCDNCKSKFNNCCCEDCKEISLLPIEEQRALRKGKKNLRNVFKKGKSDVLKYKS